MDNRDGAGIYLSRSQIITLFLSNSALMLLVFFIGLSAGRSEENISTAADQSSVVRHPVISEGSSLFQEENIGIGR